MRMTNACLTASRTGETIQIIQYSIIEYDNYYVHVILSSSTHCGDLSQHYSVHTFGALSIYQRWSLLQVCGCRGDVAVQEFAPP